MAQMYFDVWQADDLNGTALGELSEAFAKHIRVVDNAIGNGQFTINRHSSQYAWAAPDNFVRVRRVTGGPFAYDDSRYIFGFFIEEGQDTLVSTDEEGGENVTRGGRDGIVLLQRGVIYPDAYHPDNAVYAERARKDGVWRINSANFATGRGPGEVLRIFFRDQTSKTPNPIAPMVTDFAIQVDSNGTPWDVDQTDWKFPVGDDLLSLTSKLVASGLYYKCNPAFVLSAYNSRQGSDLSASIVFAKDDNIKTIAERTVHASPVVSRVLVKGSTDTDELRYREVVDAAVETALGRREGYTEYDATPTVERLDIAGQKFIDKLKNQHDGPSTLGAIDTTGRTAFVDYFPGDTVAVDIPGEWDELPLRVNAINLDDIENGEYDPTLEFLESPWDGQSGTDATEPGIAEPPGGTTGPGPGGCRDCPPLEPYVPGEGSLGEALGEIAVEYRPQITDGAGTIDFNSDGDDGLPGDDSHPIPDGLTYLGTPFNRTGFQVDRDGRVDIYYGENCSIASGDPTSLTSKVFLNGAEIGTDTDSIGPGLMFRSHETAITIADVAVSIGDLITVTSVFKEGGVATVPPVSGAAPARLELSDIRWATANPTPPIPGQLGNESMAGGAAGTTYTTNYPYQPGSLVVTVGGITVVPTETDPAAGEFTLPVDATGQQVVVRYVIASSTGTGATNPPPTPSSEVGGGATGTVSGMVPYFIPAADSFRVPEFRQALFAMTIEVEGVLAVDGYLLEVD